MSDFDDQVIVKILSTCRIHIRSIYRVSVWKTLLLKGRFSGRCCLVTHIFHNFSLKATCSWWIGHPVRSNTTRVVTEKKYGLYSDNHYLPHIENYNF